jgi:hypothetical protein
VAKETIMANISAASQSASASIEAMKSGANSSEKKKEKASASSLSRASQRIGEIISAAGMAKMKISKIEMK